MDQHANFAYSTVAAAPSPALSGTSLTIADASQLPAAPFNMTVWPTGVLPLASNAEIVRVTNIAGNVLTITRAQEATPARAILDGDQIALTITKKVITDIEDALGGGTVLTNIRVSAGTLSALRSDLTFGNGSGVSFGLDGAGVITATVQTNYLTTAMQSNRGSDFVQAVAAFAGTNATGTIASNGISVSVAPTVAQTNQTVGLYASSNTYLTSSGTVDARSLSFRGDRSITVGISNGEVAFSVGAYLTTAMQSNRGSDFVQAAAVFNGTNASGTIASNALSVSVNAQTVQTQNLIAASLSGNTAGVLALVSSGTLILAGGNNITVSQNGQSVTISGANAGGAQTAISGIVVSDATYTSGTVSFSNQANVTIGSSVDGVTQYIRLSGNPAQTVQTQNLYNLTLSGNTSGVMAQVSSGTLTLAGGNNITLSQNGNAITISGANVGGAQTGISGIVVSDATYTSGTVSFSNQANITIGSSVNGGTQYIRLSGNPAQTVQTQSLIAAVYDGANSISTGTIRFTNANGVTFTINGQTVSGSVATSYLASNASTNYVQANAAFNGTNASGTIASNAISVSVAAPIPIGTSVNPVASASSVGTVTRYAPEDHRHAGIGAIGISTAGNSAGTSGSNVGTYWVQGGNSLTVSQITSNNGSHTLILSVGNYLTTAMASNRGSDFVQATAVFNGTNATGTIASGAISVSVAAQSNQSAIRGFGVSNTGQTAGNTGISTGVDWVLAGSQSITLSQSTAGGGPNTVWVQHPAWLTTAMQSNAVTLSNIRVSAGTTSNLLSAVTFADGSGVLWGINGSTVTASVRTDYLTTQSTQFLALTLGGNTAGTTTFHATNNASLFLNGGNNITLSGNGSTVTISAASQSVQSLGLYMSSNTTSSVSSGTVDARSLTFRGMGVVSVGYSGGEVVVSVPAGGGGLTAINVSAGTTSNNLSALTFADSNGVSFGLDASTVTASVATYATVGTATTGYPVASANSVGTVTRWAAEDHRHAGIGGFGISTAGNSAGTTGSQVGTYWLQGGNNITVSQITSNNGSHTAILSGPTPATASMWPHPLPGSTALSTLYSGSTSQGAGGGSTRTGYTFSLYAVPLVLPVAVGFSELRHGLSMNTAVGTGSVTHIVSAGFYTNNASTLSLVTAFYGGLLMSQNSQTSQTFSVVTFSSGGATAGGNGGFAGLEFSSVYSRAVANMSSNSQVYGRLQFLRLGTGASQSLSAGQYYYVLGYKSVSSGANFLSNVGHLMSDAITSQAIPDMGRENNTQTSNYLPAWGAISTSFSSNSNAASFFPLPNAIPISDMTLSESSAHRFHFPVLRNHS